MLSKLSKLFLLSLAVLVLAFGIVGCSKDKRSGLDYQMTAFKVVDENEKVIENATLSIAGVQVTGENGLYKAPLEVDKEYTLRSTAPGYHDYNQTYQPQKANTVFAVQMERWKVDVQGTIISASGPVGNTTVSISELGRDAVTGNDGVFYFTDVPAGNGDQEKYTFLFKRSGFNDKSMKVHVDEKQTQKMTVPKGRLASASVDSTDETQERNVFSLGEIDLSSLPTGVRGRVIDGVSRKPFAGISFVIQGSQGDLNISTDDSGNFAQELTEGSYILIFTINNYQPLELPFDLKAGNEKDFGSIYIDPLNGSISGVVKNAVDDRAVHNALVKLVQENRLINTDSKGFFAFDNLYPNDYTIVVSHPDFADKTVNINVESNAVKEVVVSLVSNPGSVKGVTQGYAGVLIVETGESVTADNNGNFRIEGLAEGNYNLAISHNDYEDKSVGFSIVKNKKTDLGQITLTAKNGSLSGSTVAGSSVSFAGQNKVADGTGDFSIVDVVPGTYTLMITHPDYHSFSQDYPLGPNENKAVGNIALDGKPGSITGKVENALNSSPLQGASVTVLDTGDNTTTNSSGNFTISGIEAGSYTLQVVHNDFADYTSNFTVDVNRATDIGVIFLTASPGSVSGITQAGADITLTGDNTYNSSADSAGNFSISGVVPGSYTLTVSHPDYYQSDQSVVVGIGKNTNVGSVPLNPKEGTVSGETVLNSVVELNGQLINITDPADPTFTFNSVPVGTHTLIVSHPDYEQYTRSVTLGANQSVNLGVISLTARPGSISGRVTNIADGIEVVNATVKLVELNKLDTTDSSGRYSFAGIAEGYYTIEITHNDYSIKSVPVNVAKNQNTTMNVDLTANPGSVKGITQPNADIKVVETGDNTRADNNGNFRITGLAEGNYNLAISHNDYEDKSVGFSIVKNKKTDLGQITLTAKNGSLSGSTVAGSSVSFAGQNKVADGTGDFSIVDVVPGTYTLMITHPDYHSFSQDYPLGPNENKAVGNIALDGKPGSITGKVENALNSSPLQGASVTVLDTGDNTTTNSSGNFTISGIEAGSYTLQVVHNDFADHTSNFTVDVNRATDIGVISLTASPGSVSGITLPDAELALTGNNTYNGSADSAGNFSISGVVPGTYTLTVTHPDYFQAEQIVVVDIGENTNTGIINLDPRPGKIRGVAPFHNSVVRLNGSNTVTITDTVDFSFEYNGVPVGEHMVSISFTDYQTKEIAVGVGPNQTVNLGSVVLDALPGSIAGKVTDSTGNPLENVRVRVVETGEHLFTDAQGRYRFDYLPEGSYELDYMLTGFAKLTETVIVAKNKTTAKDIKLVASPGSLSGITHPGSVNISMTGTTNYSFSSGSNGNFSQTGIIPGTYSVTFSKPDYQEVSKTGVIVEKGLNSDIGTISLSALPGTLSGKTTPGAAVAFAGQSVLANISGDFTVSGVSPGTYTLRIEKADYQTFTKEYTITPNSNTDIGEFLLVGLPGSVSGLVLSSLDSSGITGAVVTVRETGQSAITDAGGNYTISNVVPGSYNLDIAENSHHSGTASFSVSPNTATNAGTVTLAVKNGSLSGITENGAEISMTGAASYNMTADSSGNFSQTGVVPGVYSVAIGKAGYSNRNVNNILVRPGENTDIGQIQLDFLKGSITGKIVAILSEEAIPNVSISGAGNTTSDNNGFFTLPDLEPGDYTLTIRMIEHEDIILNVVVNPGETTDLGIIRMERLNSGKGNIDVTVYDEENNVISATVKLVELGLTTTSGSGVEWSNIDEGTYNIVATKTGYFSTTATVTVFSDKTTNFSINLLSNEALSDKGYVEGYLRMSDGQPLANKLVEIGGLGAYTDANGYYRIKLTEGTYTSISVERADSSSVPASVTVTRNATRRLDFTGEILSHKVSFDSMSSGNLNVPVDYKVRRVKIYNNNYLRAFDVGIYNEGGILLVRHQNEKDGTYYYNIPFSTISKDSYYTFNCGSDDSGWFTVTWYPN